MSRYLLIFLCGVFAGLSTHFFPEDTSPANFDFGTPEIKRTQRTEAVQTSDEPQQGHRQIDDVAQLVALKTKAMIMPAIHDVLRAELSKSTLTNSEAPTKTANTNDPSTNEKQRVIIEEQRSYAQLLLQNAEDSGFIPISSFDEFEDIIAPLPSDERYELTRRLTVLFNAGELSMTDE